MKRENKMRAWSSRTITEAALIAALYVALTLMFEPISFGPIQFRISEMFCVLPYFTPAAVPGLFAGCLLGNILGGAMLPDIVFGSLATLVGAVGSYMLRGNKYFVCIPPILANMAIIPPVLKYAYNFEGALSYFIITVGIGEILAVGVIGNILLSILEKYKGRLFLGQEA